MGDGATGRQTQPGDVADTIGTYSLALSACHHGVGFMVVAPCSTLDLGAVSKPTTQKIAGLMGVQ